MTFIDKVQFELKMLWVFLVVLCNIFDVLFQINMTLRASLQKLKQNISQLKDGVLRASSSRRMYPFLLMMCHAVSVMRSGL